MRVQSMFKILQNYILTRNRLIYLSESILVKNGQKSKT